MDGLQVNPYNRYDQKLTVKAPKNRYAILSTMILRQESTPVRITAEGKYQTPRWVNFIRKSSWQEIFFGLELHIHFSLETS